MQASVLSPWQIVSLDYSEWIDSVAYADLDGLFDRMNFHLHHALSLRFRNDLDRSRWCINLGTEQSQIPTECRKTTKPFSSRFSFNNSFSLVCGETFHLSDRGDWNKWSDRFEHWTILCSNHHWTNGKSLSDWFIVSFLGFSGHSRNTRVTMLILNITKRTKCIRIAK